MKVIGQKTGEANRITTAQADLFCLSASDKFSRDKNYECYSSADSIRLTAVKNEYECAQIVLQAKERLAFSLVLEDLQSEQGALRADCMTPYLIKNIAIEKSYMGNGYAAGEYPDALLPFAVAQKYGENQLQAGEVGGVWLDIKIPKNQPAGIYTGKVTLCLPTPVEIPVCVEVLEVALADEMRTQTLFNTKFCRFADFEKGDFAKLYEEYAAYFLEHRICQTGLVAPVDLFAQEEGEEEENISALLDAIETWWKKGISTLNIPTKLKRKGEGKVFDEEYAFTFICRLAERCQKSGVNYFNKVVFYDHLIDEPFGIYFEKGQVKYSIELFEKTKRRAAEACKSLPFASQAFAEEVCASILQIPELVTDYFEKPFGFRRELLDEKGDPYQYDPKKVLLCPTIDVFDTEKCRAQYESYQNKWWYTCNAPNSPFPGYRIDEPGYTPRIMGWMQAEYGVQGNLYWENNYWLKEVTLNAYEKPEHGCESNGEGMIVYPGSPYGIFGPVGSIRLKNIREGNEDYELLRDFIERYQAEGYSAKEILHRYTCGIYDGTKSDNYSPLADLAREGLVRLLELCISKHALYLSATEGREEVTFTLTAARECEVFIEGKALARDEEGKMTYTTGYVKDGFLELVADMGGVKRVLPLYIGKGIRITMPETLFRRNKVRGDVYRLALNQHILHREFTVTTMWWKDPKVYIEQEFEGRGSSVTMEVRANREAPFLLKIGKKRYAEGKLSVGWNKIEFTLEEKPDAPVCLQVDEYTELGLGSIYERS